MTKETLQERPPVVVVMGHIDHGKSTLIDYIRKSNITAKESGGITQHIGAYEVAHQSENGEKTITFLDTPGHEAFGSMRSKGTSVADIAVLIVSAEDGVKPQTLEAYEVIKKSGKPFVIAINKIDSPKANIPQTQTSLIENEIYLEGLGGDIPYAEISAKTGQNVDELLDLILLAVELEELKGNPNKKAEGIVIEAHKDMKKGISATIVIKDGTLHVGEVLASDCVFSPVRSIENDKNDKIESATFSNPILISGWSDMPETGSLVQTFENKKEAEAYCQENRENKPKKGGVSHVIGNENGLAIPLIIKTDVAGSGDAIVHEIRKINVDGVYFNIITQGTGNISEANAKRASSHEGTIIIGFHVDADSQAEVIKEREGLDIKIFDVIYDVSDYLKNIAEERRPRIETEEITGSAKILRIFNKTKNTQVIGGKVKEGILKVKEKIKIMRRNEEIGTGMVKGLQSQKVEVSEVTEGNEFGAAIETKVELAESDHIEAFEKKIV
ncbi:translation initiation factor IF-2 [Candidatus Nomurabacteria bacterium]|nr:translation initiation factor IF-2 [Candidatus Nomurabacteria bacterium]